MVTGPGDELAASAAGRGYLRVSHAEREQVIGTLKAAFVRGMLAKDEFDLRVSQAFASRTYAELAAVTDGLPAGPAAAQPPLARPGPGRAASSAARPGDGGGNRALRRRAGVRVPLALACGYRERSRACKDRAVPLEQPHIPARYVHLCGVPDRWVAGEAFRRAAAAAASAGRRWPGIPVPALSRSGRRASAGRSRSPAHGRC